MNSIEMNSIEMNSIEMNSMYSHKALQSMMIFLEFMICMECIKLLRSPAMKNCETEVSSNALFPSLRDSQFRKSMVHLQNEAHIRRFRQLVVLESQLKADKQQYRQTVRQIESLDAEFLLRRQQFIAKNLSNLHEQQKVRSESHCKTEQLLAQAKQRQHSKQKQMQSLLAEERRRQQSEYNQSLELRRQRISLAMRNMFAHSKQYLKSISNRQKKTYTETEVDTSSFSGLYLSRARAEYYQQSKKGEMRRERVRQLAEKRKEYGDRVERTMGSKKAARSKVKDGENYSKLVEQYEAIQKIKKPRLNTNIENVGGLASPVQKIKREKVPLLEKIRRLDHLAEGYSIKAEGGQVQAISMLCAASMARAELFLSSN